MSNNNYVFQRHTPNTWDAWPFTDHDLWNWIARTNTHTHTVIDSSAMPLAYILRFFLLLLVSLGSGKKDGRYAHDIMNK